MPTFATPHQPPLSQPFCRNPTVARSSAPDRLQQNRHAAGRNDTANVTKRTSAGQMSAFTDKLYGFGLPLLGLVIGFSLPVASSLGDDAARDWLTLEQDQRIHRERVAPLDLGPRRDLDASERTQRLELRGLQQRDARAQRLEQRRPPAATVGADVATPVVTPVPRDTRIRQRRQREAWRLDQQRQRQTPLYRPR